ncbi:MAG: N-acetylmuramoyl-L-alanine amidase [Cyanobacteria bacterium P01_A01_bin.17]
MINSSLSLLQKPDVVVLCAGHGANDPGAVHGPFKERDQAIQITDITTEVLRTNGIKVEVVPHDLNLKKSISWVNLHFDFGEAWVLELHRDSFAGLDLDDASRRCGIYYGVSQASKEIGEFVRDSFKKNGAHDKSWARPDTVSRHGSLGWIRQTDPVAHLLELGFMQGKNDDTHLSFLANLAAKVIFEAFTGKELA